MGGRSHKTWLNFSSFRTQQYHEFRAPPGIVSQLFSATGTRWCFRVGTSSQLCCRRCQATHCTFNRHSFFDNFGLSFLKYCTWCRVRNIFSDDVMTNIAAKMIPHGKQYGISCVCRDPLYCTTPMPRPETLGVDATLRCRHFALCGASLPICTAAP
jgi:hypothetical protein